MKNAIIEEIAGNWEVMAAMEDAAHPARRATFRECADMLRMMVSSDKSGEREQQLEELVRSACAIADRRGAETAWDRFTASAKSLGLNGVTARTYRILPSDKPAQEAEQASASPADPILATWPEEIWLQAGEEEPDEYPGSGSDVTWCDGPINMGDIKYIRADLVAPTTTKG